MAQTDTSPQPDNAGVIAPPPLIFIGVLAIAFALDWLFGGPSLSSLRMLAVMILLIAGGALLVPPESALALPTPMSGRPSRSPRSSPPGSTATPATRCISA